MTSCLFGKIYKWLQLLSLGLSISRETMSIANSGCQWCQFYQQPVFDFENYWVGLFINCP